MSNPAFRPGSHVALVEGGSAALDVRGVSRMVRDPRRRRRTPMLAVWCWCGRFFTITPEEARRLVKWGRAYCPDPDCGKGDK